ncbi:MAG: YihY/virulence factor BrkB family protein [Acidobacteria bacterium]|nr:YihY/virulence factor BrkB family protein [Acidobacteriota bacterium]
MRNHLFGGLSVTQLATRAGKEAMQDKVLGSAAELAYYFLFALFPMLIFLTSLVGFMPDLQTNILRALATVLPSDALRLIANTLEDVTAKRSGGLLSFGIIGTLWSASSGVVSLMDSLNIAYDVREGRSFWKQRLISIALTVGLALLIIVGTTLIMFGDRFSAWLGAALGHGTTLKVLWNVVDYILGLLMLLLGVEAVYFFGPNLKQKWGWTSVGSVFAVLAIIIGSLLFSIYLRYAPSYSATYGSLGAVIVLMLWLYIFGLVILFGGEINAEIEHALNHEPVEKESCDD